MQIQKTLNPDKEEVQIFLENAFKELDPEDESKFTEETNQSLEEWFSVDEMFDYLKHGCLVEARIDNKLVGLAFIAKQNPITWPDGHKAELFVLAVDQTIRGQGLGSKLLKATEDIAKEFGAEVIITNTNSLMNKTIDFYVKNNYQIIGELKEYYDNGNAVFLIKNLVAN